jgi:hypothetical protein
MVHAEASNLKFPGRPDTIRRIFPGSVEIVV